MLITLYNVVAIYTKSNIVNK